MPRKKIGGEKLVAVRDGEPHGRTVKKEKDPNKKVVGAAILTRDLEKFDGKLPANKHPQVIARPGFTVYLLRADDQKTITELENMGRGIGVVRYEGATSADYDDEIIFVVRK